MVNWALIHNQSLAAIVSRGLSPPCISVKSYRLWCQASCTALLPSELNLIKEFLDLYFSPWAESISVQLKPGSSILICIFTHQAEYLYNDHSGHIVPTSQDSVMWTNQTVKIWIPHLHRNGSIRDKGEHFLYINRPPLCLGGVYFWFPLKAAFLSLQTIHQHNLFFYHLPYWGLLLALDWCQWTFVD